MPNDVNEGEVLFEFRRIGAVVKVSAIHAASGIEVSLMGPPAAGQHGLKMAALRKLNHVLANRAGKD